MRVGPAIAPVAALIGDPARAQMLTALLDGRALTASELAAVAGVTAATASSHLSRLSEARLVAVARQGRHRYFRLSGPDVAGVLENLMGLAQRTGAVPSRTGPSDAALRACRVCYDHLAGERAVALAGSLERRDLLRMEPTPHLTTAGRDLFGGLGFDLESLERGRRPLCRACLDWSERRSHLAGALGAAILNHVLNRRWARRGHGRVILFSPAGEAAFERAFGQA